MPKINQFEDLICWQSSRELVRLVFLSCEKAPLSTDFGTQNQFRRAAISVMNNIAEGFGRFNKKDFINFLNYSQSSSNEIISLTYCLEDIEYLSAEEALEIRKKALETRNQTLALIKHINTTLTP